MRAPFNKKLRSEKGFTIIEVMIVLAVASLIMLIVFLAVPALQRNARNTNRTADATKIATAVNECLANNNNTTSACDTAAEVSGVTLDTATLKQLTTLTYNTSATSPAASPGSFPSGSTTAVVYYNAKCDSTGASYAAGSALSFVVLYRNETTSADTPRCISA